MCESVDRLDIYICTKSKCSAKSMQVKLYSADSRTRSYNGPGLLAAVRSVVAARRLAATVSVHETDCQSGCPVGPRMDVVCNKRRVMYFRRAKPTGRDDMVSWSSVESLEQVVDGRAG